MTAPRNAPMVVPAFDRSETERSGPELLENLRGDTATRVLLVHGDSARMTGSVAGPAAAGWAAGPASGPVTLQWTAPVDVPEGAIWAFLGRDARGRALLSAAFPPDEPPPVIGHWGSVRATAGDLVPDDAAILLTAVSLSRWLIDAPHCPACGTRADVRTSGWSRHCPTCGREHFPRTDPAVIVAVTSAVDPDRLLLGSNALWGGNRFSCFAGFVEAGESLEGTVVREVQEEAGVRVGGLRYVGSQAWPYPRSLMVGFLATAIDDDEAEADGEEIVEVRWFDRDTIGAALSGTGDVLLPGPSSIAYRLISEWYAG